jgi:Subtilase family
MTVPFTPGACRRVAGLVAIIMAAGLVHASAQQALAPRPPPQKMTLPQMQAIPSANRVHVKFREGNVVRFANGQLSGMPSADTASFQNVLGLRGIGPGAIRRMFTRPEADLDRERAEGQQSSGKQLADLNLYYIIDLPPGANAAEVADALNALDIVEHAEPERLPSPAPVDIPPATPDFTANQGYKNSPPQGIGAPTTAAILGSNGGQRAFADVEYSWRLDHEDLEIFAATNTLIPPGMTPVDPFNDTNHGTAVLGIIHGEANSYGVTGIAPSALAFVAPANFTSGYNPAAAINWAANNSFLAAGDVIVIEQQAAACGGACGANQVGCGPLEAIQSVFDAVSTATANGKIVVAAAGNGQVNLDGPACGTTFNRTVRDSGAIIVGAGSSTDHSRLSFSSYGSRVDVQGWGENVTTTGGSNADLFSFGNDERQRYTSKFDGTSSATPIVAGAVLSIQGARGSCGLTAATPLAMRQALSSTGTPQANPGTGHIGPLPRIVDALVATGGMSCIPKAVLRTPTPGTTLAGNTVTFGWTAGGGVSEYYLYVGSTAGGSDLYNQSAGTSLSATVSGLPLDGRTLYVRLWSLIFGSWQFNDYTYTAATAQKAVLTTPTPGSILPGSSTTFNWTTGNLVSQYWLYVGTSAGGSDLYNQSAGTNHSATVTGLPTDGRTIFVRLWSLIGSGWQFNDYTYTAASTQIAVLTTPAPGSVLSSASVTFGWTAGAGVSQYWLYVGSTTGGNDLFDHSAGSSLSTTVNNLPRDGRTIFVRLWSLTSGGWRFNDYTYAAGPKAVVTSPVPQSILSASSATFSWSAGSGITQYWLYVGTAAGAADVYNQSTGTGRSATVTGLPIDGRTVYVRLWSLQANNSWQFNDYTYTATGATARPLMTAPTPGVTVPGTSVAFGWSAGTGVSQYWLYVGSASGGADLFNASTGTSRTRTVNGLPTDGRLLYVRLWSLIAGTTTWQFNDYTYGAATGGIAGAAAAVAGNSGA